MKVVVLNKNKGIVSVKGALVAVKLNKNEITAIHPKDLGGLDFSALTDYVNKMRFSSKFTLENPIKITEKLDWTEYYLQSLKPKVFTDPFLNKILRYAFKKHILIEGEKGGGKTYTISKWVDSVGIPNVFVAGHEGMEASDLLGSVFPATDGTLIWKDGAVTEAFRKAQKEPTVLFFDELLRVPARELNLLVGALTPNARGEYVLRTNRIIEVVDGIGTEEVLKVPSGNLWVIGTTNVGAGYQVDDIDEALSDRFRSFIKELTDDEIKKILSSKTSNTDIVNKLFTFYKFMKKAYEEGNLTRVINLRHLTEALDLADPANLEQDVIANIIDLIPHWVARTTDGSLNSEQEKKVSLYIKEAFGIED